MIIFAFNPNVITVNTNEKVTFYIGPYIDEREPFEGKVNIDISKYVQCIFRHNEYYIAFDVYVQIGEAPKTALYFESLWGAINVGECFNKSHTVTWFKAYPMSVSYYQPAGSTLSVSVDDGPYKIISETDSGLLEFPMKGYENSRLVKLKIESSQTTVITINISDRTDGIYCRWVDRHAFTRYYLFSKGAITRQSKHGEAVSVGYDPERPMYGEKRCNKTLVKTMHVGAPFVPRDMMDWLRMIETSPIVEAYIDNRWVSVIVKQSTHKDGEDDLQDYELDLILPEVTTQSL